MGAYILRDLVKLTWHALPCVGTHGSLSGLQQETERERFRV